MSDRVPLRDYRESRAVLIATSTYTFLDDVPAAANSLHRMAGLLTSQLCGWPSGQITVIENETGPGNLHHRLIKSFRDVTDVALFYFVGHGQVDDSDQLCLGLVESSVEADLRASTSLEFQDVRDAMIRSPAATKILILDCCSSGLANQRKNTLGTSAELADKTAGTGAYTMAACHPYGTASFETDGPWPQTYFTKYFIDLVEAGIPGQPAGLRLRPIFLQLREALAADGHPRPVERNIDSANGFVIAYNAAPVQVQIDIPTAFQLMDARIAKIEAQATAHAEQAEVAVDLGPTAEHAPDDGSFSAPEPAPGRAELVASMRAKAVDLLRAKRGEAFRSVEAELQQLGASARPTAVLQTSKGDITIQLLPDYAPEAVRNFKELAEGTRPWVHPRNKEFREGTRLYDGTIFHRTVPGFMIQGGDPTGTGTGGPGYQLPDEFHADLDFDRPYLLAMANSGPNSNGSQFFITVAPALWLNNKHTIFGLVIQGRSVADEISRVRTGPGDRPLENVVLKAVHVNGDPVSDTST
jgi:cyclophilin family peptidyl-prolyl cis-trans isomerase